ncbi:MAG: membrane protein [Peptococcaceae bacterium BICA1-7]|nr:MAG: membrane protein [Peptococcaceae bacterium BICA1-7]
MDYLKNYSYIFLTILFTVYGQLILKWQMSNVQGLPENIVEKFIFLLRVCLNPWIISTFMAAFLAAISWMTALTKLQLSQAYPFLSLAFVLVFILSGLLFNETITVTKVLGLLFVVVGIILGSRG